MATPLKPVLDLYARPDRRLVLHVIYLVTPIEQIPLSKMPGALAGLGRYFSMNEVLNIKNDVVRPERRSWDSDEGRNESRHHSSLPAALPHHQLVRVRQPSAGSPQRTLRRAGTVFYHDCAAEGCIFAEGPLERSRTQARHHPIGRRWLRRL